MKYIIYILFAVSATLIAVNRLTAFYISDYRVHYVVLFIAATTFVLIVGRLFNTLKTSKAILVTCLVVGVLCFVKAYFTWGGDWKTETILYRSHDDPGKTIDKQLRGDRFAFGYKTRVVEISRLAPGMVWTRDVDTLKLDRQWQRVDERISNP